MTRRVEDQLSFDERSAEPLKNSPSNHLMPDLRPCFADARGLQETAEERRSRDGSTRMEERVNEADDVMPGQHRAEYANEIAESKRYQLIYLSIGARR